MKKLWMLCLVFGSLHAGSVRLSNDSAFKLIAKIRGADGSDMGTVVVNPQQTMSWNDYWGSVGSYTQSKTPYTVAWYCEEDGTDFSVCNQVPTGATVTAMTCGGARACKTKKPAVGPNGIPAPSSPDPLQQADQSQAGPPSG